MKVIEKKTIYNIPVYVADDGKEFISERDCRNYEDSLRMKKVKTREFDNLYPFFSTFFYIDSLETLEFLKRYQFGGLAKTINDNFIKIGDWVAVKYEYNSNGADDYDLITIEEIWTELVNFLNETEFGDENV